MRKKCDIDNRALAKDRGDTKRERRNYGREKWEKIEERERIREKSNIESQITV